MKTTLTSEDKRLKFLWEAKDILAGVAFPVIILIIFSSTIIAFAFSDLEDLAIKVLAVAGGEILIIIAFIIFGRQNGATAYRKYVLNERKRALGTDDKRCAFKTGEYALWKGALIGFLAAVPYLVFEIINMIYANDVCEVVLQYGCGWACFPSKLAGAPEALNLIMVLLPVLVHTLGYILGKAKEVKIQQQIAEESAKSKKGKRKTQDEEEEFIDPLDEEFMNVKKGKRKK